MQLPSIIQEHNCVQGEISGDIDKIVDVNNEDLGSGKVVY